jgi:hypothetical protein
LNYIVLDDFAPWAIYVPALFVLLVFLLAITILIHGLRREGERAGDRHGKSRSIRLQWIFAVASAVALWFMATSMFWRFHAVSVDPLYVKLEYLWPQPAAVIPRTEIVDVTLSRGARTCGHLEVATRQKRYSSVNFKRCKEAETILKELAQRGSR